MKIIVVGGSGLIGSKLVKSFGEQGHEAIAALPKSGVNTLTGEGLAEVLKMHRWSSTCLILHRSRTQG